MRKGKLENLVLTGNNVGKRDTGKQCVTSLINREVEQGKLRIMKDRRLL